MIKNYMITARRSLLNHKVLSGINILGLAIGISASLILYLLVSYHFSFNHSLQDGDRIYRVVSKFGSSNEIYHNSGVCDPMGHAVKREIAGLDAVVSFRRWDEVPKISVQSATAKDPLVFKKQDNFIFADSDYFRLVTYTWLAGSPSSSLSNPYQVVLTESYAKRYFPGIKTPAILGRELLVNDSIRLTVSGVVKDINRNTDFIFKAFVAYNTLETTALKPQNWNDWNSTNGAQQLYLKLSPASNARVIERQIAILYDKYQVKEPGDDTKTWHPLQPLSDVHFNADYHAYGAPAGHKPTLYGLLAIAVFLLLLGCINFINLTTAYAFQRAKEIGIRKAVGSSRLQLVWQFLSETFVLTVLATLLSVLLVMLVPYKYTNIIPEEVHLNIISQPAILLFLIALVLLVTLLAGFYPALVLSKYNPILVLKNQAFSRKGKTGKASLRKLLTVSQFVIAYVFVMSTILVSKQIYYSLNRDMGFKKEAILFLTINSNHTTQAQKHVLLDKLRAIPEIAMVSLSTNPPSTTSTWSSTIKYRDGKQEIQTDVQQKFGDSNYIKLYHLKLLAGSNISNTDTVTSLLINETYARILGFRTPAEAIGKYLELDDSQLPVIGVVADFMQGSSHEPVKPIIISSWSNIELRVNIALQPENEAHTTWQTAIRKTEAAFKEVYPPDDFSYRFFDDEIAAYYTTEKNISGLLKWATGLAVFISCLGLLGLAIYTTAQRTKEIGVRKVLGASVPQVVSLISKDFIRPLLLAFAISVPLAWLVMHKWLENFAFRTEISWWIFLLSIVIMITIALLTLAFQILKTALANPVKSLRTE